jgi:hypothetical protein
MIEYRVALLKSDLAWKFWKIYISPEEFLNGHTIDRGLIDRKRFERLGNLVYENWHYMSKIPHTPGLKKSVEFLLRCGHQVVIITTASGKAGEMVDKWLRHQKLPSLPRISCSNGKANGKANLLKSLGQQGFVDHLGNPAGLDIYIDNQLRILDTLVGTGPQLFFFKEQFDSSQRINKSIQVVRSWRELRTEICKFCYQRHYGYRLL